MPPQNEALASTPEPPDETPRHRRGANPSRAEGRAAPPPGALRSAGLRLPWVVLVASLGLTTLVSYYAAQGRRIEAARSLDESADQIQTRIVTRIEAHIAMLRGGAALLASRGDIDRAAFHAYVKRLRLMLWYPGIQGVGYSVRVAPAALDSLTRSVRADAWPGFHVWPDSVARAEYHAIVYLEPPDTRNQAAIGYDMSTQPVRRAAMERARDTGMPTLSGAVTLVQETVEPRQPGFLIYVPVYRNGGLPSTPEARRDSLQGYVYGPFRANDLFSAIFGDGPEKWADFSVYDDTLPVADALLYRSPGAAADNGYRSTYATRRTISMPGRRWLVTIASRPAFDAMYGRGRLAAAVSVGGVVVSLLLFGMTHRESEARLQAEDAGHLSELSRNALRHSEARKSAIIESAIDCIITADRRGCITEFNPAAERTFGRRRQDVIGRPIAEMIIPPQLRGAHNERFGSYVATGEAHILGQRLELTGMRADGSEFPIELGITATHVDGEPVFTAHLRDITERQRAEHSLRESEARFQHIADTAPVMIRTSTPEGSCTFFNARWLEFRGRSIEQELGNGWMGGVHPEDLQYCLDTYSRAVEAREDFVLEYRLLRNDGAYRWITDHGTPRYNPSGEFLGYIGSSVDVTARKMSEQELERRVSERTLALSEANTELESFSWSVSRELAAAVHAIDGYARELGEDVGTALPAAVHAAGQRIHAAASHMGRLTEDLLAFARVGRQPLERRRVPAGDIARAALADLRAEMDGRRVEVEIGRLPTVFADPALLRQVYMDLLSNALAHTRGRPQPHIEIGCTDGMPAILFVRDNGEGHDRHRIEKAFSGGTRLDASGDAAGGMVGLVLVQRIVQRHGGRVWAEVDPEQGATYYFQLEGGSHRGD